MAESFPQQSSAPEVQFAWTSSSRSKRMHNLCEDLCGLETALFPLRTFDIQPKWPSHASRCPLQHYSPWFDSESYWFFSCSWQRVNNLSYCKAVYESEYTLEYTNFHIISMNMSLRKNSTHQGWYVSVCLSYMFEAISSALCSTEGG